MSGRQREDYHHGRSSRHADPNDRTLPPIREVFREELGGPAQPGAYSFREVQNALPALGSASQRPPWQGYAGYPTREQRGGFAIHPPIQYSGGHAPPPPSSSHQHHARRSSSSGRDYTTTTTPSEGPGYSYGVLRTSGTSGSLTDATPPSDRPQGILRQTSAPAREDPEDLSKRYKCDYCGKRFGMPSHLQIHLRIHTAQRPFACPWTGCDRTFSVRSNMTRHIRSHEEKQQKNSASALHMEQQQVTTMLSSSSRYEYDEDEDSGGEQDEPGPSSSGYFHTGSSGGSSRPSGQYYSSSHHK